MNKTKRTWLICLTAVGSLLLASLLTAQEAGNPALTEDAPIGVRTNSAGAEQGAEAEDAGPNARAAVSTNEPATEQNEEYQASPRQIVLTGQNVEVKAGETVREVVVIGGSAKIHGKVLQDAVVIMGGLELDGEVGGDTVAVMGSIKMHPGAVVHKDAVTVMGNLTIPDGAKVEKDAVSVAGTLDAAPGAIIAGQRVNIGLPVHFPRLEGLNKWWKYCVFELRPLAPQVAWVWIVYGVFFLLSLFVAAVFPRPVQACVEALSRRPATTFLMGLLTKLLVPIVVVILAVTGIGLLIVPFVLVALFIGVLVGKIAIREWIGFQIGRHFGGGIQNALVAFLIGAFVTTLLYMVPVLGLLTLMVLSVWGLGCAVTAVFGSMRRELPDKPASRQPANAPPVAVAGVVPMPPAGAPGVGAGFVPGGTSAAEPPLPTLTGAPAQSATAQLQTGTAAAPAAPPVYPPALSFPRAGFWERMGAAFLDVVIVSILSAFVGGLPLGLLVALAYFSGMWAWQGTTIGGIVLKLKVVRSDGSPLTFLVALVRGLAAALSVVVFFLGFLWIAWDRDKQGWHDKIAGTEVVRLPRSAPLVCI